MNIKECYDAFGGSYEEAKSRLQSDSLVERFAIKFLSDPSYDALCKAMEEQDFEAAFRAAYTLKGVSMNLSFHRLGASSKVLTETLRGWESGSVDTGLCAEQFMLVAGDYEAVVEAVRKLADEK